MGRIEEINETAFKVASDPPSKPGGGSPFSNRIISQFHIRGGGRQREAYSAVLGTLQFHSLRLQMAVQGPVLELCGAGGEILQHGHYGRSERNIL